jgi:regulatory protein
VSRRIRPPSPLAPERAWDYALLLLGRRAYTVHEMRERLRRRALAEHEVARVVGRLEELRLVDDRAFARAYVASRADTHGVLALRHALRRKGVAEAIVDDVLADRSEHDQLAAAEALLRKHAWRFASPKTAEAGRARAFALLARRGFAPDAAREAVDAVLPPNED